MLQPRSIQSTLGIKDKILSLDYVLVISILLLGIISMFAMYSTDGGEFKYHTNSHILRFLYSLECFLCFIYFYKILARNKLFNLYRSIYFTSGSKIFWINIIRI